MAQEKRAVWEEYVRAWREGTVEGKTRALQNSAAGNNVYRDPLATCTGHTELIGYMLQLLNSAPGCYFETTHFLEHHDASIARWNMVGADGVVMSDGMSYAQYDGQGLLVSETGFFEVPTQ
jgi:hypothetical protein